MKQMLLIALATIATSTSFAFGMYCSDHDLATNACPVVSTSQKQALKICGAQGMDTVRVRDSHNNTLGFACVMNDGE